MRGLTQRQRDVLHAIRDLRRRHRLSPTMREIATALGGRSPCTVQHHVDALVEKGFVTRKPGLARTLKLTGKREE